MTFVRLAGCNAPALGLDCVALVRHAGELGARVRGGAGAGGDPRAGALPARVPHRGRTSAAAEGVVALVAEARTGASRCIWRRTAPWSRLRPRRGRTGGGPRADGDSLFDWAVVSPKPPDYFIAPGWDGLVDELKLVADERLEAATAERLAARHPEAIVCIQPVWERGPGPEGRQPPRPPAAGGHLRGAGPSGL